MSLRPEQPAPVAARVPHVITTHGHSREDPWFWLRDDERKDPEVLAYLEAENAYTAAVLGPLSPLKQRLFEELKGRIKKDDSSVPVRIGHYSYRSRFEAGREHAIHCRTRVKDDTGTAVQGAEETVILDVNALAEPHAYYAVRSLSVSESEHLLAWAEDAVSRRIYTVRVKDLRTGEVLPDQLPGGNGSFAWAADDAHLFYVKREEATMRSHQVWRHRIGTSADDDVLVFEEPDPTFWLSVRRAKTHGYVFIESHSTLVTEVLAVDASRPLEDFRPVLTRQADHEYQVWHGHGAFWIRSNHDAPNFRLLRLPVDRWVSGTPTLGDCEEIIPHRSDALFSGIELFDGHLVVSERVDGLRSIRIMPMGAGGMPESGETLAFDEPLRTAHVGQNPSFDTTVLRFGYSSPITPPQVWEVDMVTGERTLLKQDEVLGGYDPSNYATERQWAVARDGTRVPISLSWRKGTRDGGPAPVYQYAYGSYGHSMDPGFVPSRISLMDRGLIIATTHVRGGQEMGRHWYESGKLQNKLNTFTDFIDATEFLVEGGVADPEQVVAAGGSAGGMLMGGIANMRPDLYRTIHAAVPFVDCVSTMLDDTIPLTTFEYDEWGNPNREADYHYMLRYSPYDNVTARDYPNLIVTTGLHDSQVQYWEPAKWVARLRATVTGDSLIVLDTDMDTGHGGTTGRFKRYEQTAKEYALILYTLGIDE